MKKYKLAIILSLSILAIFGILFGYVLPGYAQDDQEWTNPVNLSLSGSATNPMLAIDVDNSLHAIWIDKVDGYKYSQSTDGVTWTKPQMVKFPFDKSGALPVIFSDSTGYFHIFWISNDANLFYAETTPSNMANLTNWKTTIRLAQGVANYDVVLDSQGVLHLAYIQYKSTEDNPAGVYYIQSNIGGGSWNNPVKLYESEYLRSATGNESSIRIATSNSSPDQNVYVVWDSRSQKRVFMAVSNDSGSNWNETQQVKGVEDIGGIDTPFNLNVAALNNQVLIMWQAGEPGTAKCEMFSQLSKDNGVSWGDIVSVLNGRTDCPISSKFIVQEEDYFVAMLTGQEDPSLVAWNGKQWSDPQTQTRLPSFSNPLTYDAILFGCRYDLIKQNSLYVVGCDQGEGGDVWFLSRPLENVENWFSLPNTWGAPDIISGESETISSLNSVSDTRGAIHSIWVQSSLSSDSSQKIAMEYARWDGKQWTSPEPVISSLNSIPLQISFAADTQERLLLSWVDESSGDLLFSWAILDSGNLASDWETPVVLPSPSRLIESPNIVVDGSGRIVVAYAVPLNENRGIYIVQSTDNGETWSSPVRVFDAVSADWEKIGNPNLSLSADGTLLLIFSRHYIRAGQSTGLYYSSSLDGGTTWSDPQILSEGDIQWSDIVSYGAHTVQAVWQEYDGLVFANLSQESQDGGISWNRPIDITGVNDSSTKVTLAADGFGKMHFIQLLKDNNATTINQENFILQDWEWTGSVWEFASSSNLVISGQGINYSLTADVTSTGFLGVSVSAEYSDSNKTIQNEILTFNRFLEDANTSDELTVPLIPTPIVFTNATEIPSTALPDQPVDLSMLNDDNVATSALVRNIVGIVIIIVVLVVTAILLVRRRTPKIQK